MKSVDTNVLLRFIVADDRAQHVIARRFFEAIASQGERALVTLPVLCELAWVLSSRYSYSKAEIYAVIDDLTSAAIFVVEREREVALALASFRDGKAGFADYLIGEISRDFGASETVTFDRTLKGAPGFTVLG